MAFMMPVMKNNYDIYKDSRSRKTSECSSNGGGGGSNGPTTLASAIGTPTAGMNGGRRRKVSECKSESFATSPTHGIGGGGGNNNYRMQMQRCQSSRAFPRNTSRSSHSSMLSPTRSFSQSGGGVGSSSVAASGSVNGSPPKQTTTTTATSTAKHETKTGVSDGQNDFTKFHMRLVDKLRKSFRKDNAKRS